MDRPGHQTAVGPQHKAAQLRAQRHVAHTCGHQHVLVSVPHALPDHQDIVWLLVGAVGDADAAGQVDKGDARPGLLLQLHRQLKKLSG